MLEKGYYYIPSLTGHFLGQAKYKNNVDLRWWSKECPFYYPYALISYWYGKGWTNFRDHHNMRETLLISDSGGFELLNPQNFINPVEVIDWEENNSNVGLTLDLPPVDPISFKIANKEHFGKCASKTRANTEIMAKNRKKFASDGFLFYGVTHGNNFKDLNDWYTTIGGMKEFGFDGMAISVKPPTDVNLISNALSFMVSKGVKKVHVFNGTGASILPMTIYASKYFDTITIDSSSPSQLAVYGKYCLTPLNYTLSIGRPIKRSGDEFTPPCNCPICKEFKNDPNVWSEVMGSNLGRITAIHNLYKFVDYGEMFKTQIHNEEMFLELSRLYAGDETVQAILNFRKHVEQGIDYNEGLGDWL